MQRPIVLKLDNDTRFEMPLLSGYLSRHDLQLLEQPLKNALTAIANNAPGILVTGAAAIDRDIIEIAHNHGLRGIVKAGTGLDNIDSAYARSRGITVVNTPAYAAETVAEYAVSLMLALSRKLIPLQRAMRREGWVAAKPEWVGNELFRKTIGLVGFGHIAKSVSRMAHHGFQMPVLAFDPHVSAEVMTESGVQKVDSLEQLLPQSDIVSIHCPLNASTRHIIGAKQLATMKSSALLINVSRGGLIDEAALATALREGKIGGAALDVYSSEPLNVKTDPVISTIVEMNNVILLSHLAWYTEEAAERLQDSVAQHCVDIISGEIE